MHTMFAIHINGLSFLKQKHNFIDLPKVINFKAHKQ